MKKGTLILAILLSVVVADAFATGSLLSVEELAIAKAQAIRQLSQNTSYVCGANEMDLSHGEAAQSTSITTGRNDFLQAQISQAQSAQVLESSTDQRSLRYDTLQSSGVTYRHSLRTDLATGKLISFRFQTIQIDGNISEEQICIAF